MSERKLRVGIIGMGDEFSFQGHGALTAFGDGGTLTANIPGFGAVPADSLLLEKNGVRQAVAIGGSNISPAAAFVASILDGAPNMATVEDAVQVVAVIQAAYRSAAERCIIRLDESI